MFVRPSRREYSPDRWVVLYYPKEDVNAILGGWSGGYTTGDSWRRSTAIQHVVEHDEHYEVHNRSGSVYMLRKDAYGINSIMSQLLPSLGSTMVLDEDDALVIIDFYTKEEENDD